LGKRLVQVLAVLISVALLLLIGKGVYWIAKRVEEARVLRKVIERLSADSRIAEVLVTQSRYDEEAARMETTIKFLEYDAGSVPLPPRYFTFRGNVIQFQALVIRFDDKLVQAGDWLRGRSAYLFLRAFALDAENTQVFPLTETNDIPPGYKVPGPASEFERKLWKEFWTYALDPKARQRAGIKNAQIEAPGSMFVPGTIYTVRIEHAGGIRIDSAPVPEILKGETVLSEGEA